MFIYGVPELVGNSSASKVFWRNTPDTQTLKVYNPAQAYYDPTPAGADVNTVQQGDLAYIDSNGFVRKYIAGTTSLSDLLNGGGSLGFISYIQCNSQPMHETAIAQSDEVISYDSQDNAPLVALATIPAWELYEDQLLFIDATGTRLTFTYAAVIPGTFLEGTYVTKGPNTYGSRQMIKFVK